MIGAVTHKLINYVRYRLYTYHSKTNWLFVYVFVRQLGKITVKVRKPPEYSISFKIVGHVASMRFVRK